MVESEDSKIEEYRELLFVYNITKLAKKLDIPYRTLNDFCSGKTKRPNAEVYEKLQKYFESQSKRS